MRAVRRTDSETSRGAGRGRVEPAASLRLVRPDEGPGASRRAGEIDRTVVTGPVEDRTRRGGDADHQHVKQVRDRREESQEHARANREWEVRAEMASAASIPAHDARWVTAARASQAIEGGKAAVLRPEVRAKIVNSAERMGLRPFDANLVLAIVQDAARHGQTIQDLDTIDRLAMVRGRTPAAAAPRSRGVFVSLCLALSAMWALLLIWWLRG